MADGTSGDELVKRAKAVRTKADLAAFVRLLLRNYREHPAEWENDSLGLYLEGLAGFVEDLQGYYSNAGAEVDPDRPGWRVLAELLLAARVYE
jgi:hypothetical protein